MVGVHSPRFPFTADAGKLARGARAARGRASRRRRLRYAVWHDYGCEGWPSLFLWGRGGALRWFHFGEGEYAATEEAIREELRGRRPGLELPEPLAPLRASDAPGALVAPPSDEVFPGGSATEPWRPREDDPPLELDYAAGGA